MQNEFNEKLSAAGGNLTFLLDKITHDCEDYFNAYDVISDINYSKGMTCSNTFQPPHYGLGGKCFPSVGITKLSNRDLSFTLKDFPTSLKLNHNIAAKDALAYGSYSVGLMTQARDLYSHDYVDLTPVATNDITYIMLTRRTNDLTNSDRYIDAPLCERNSSYDRKECSR